VWALRAYGAVGGEGLVKKVGPASLVALFLWGCGSNIYATYDYSKEYDPRKHEYVIGVSDQIAIGVYHAPDLSAQGTVRPDGVVTMPLVGDLLVAGKTPSQVRDDMKAKLAIYLKDDAVINVTVTAFNSYRFIVAGNVNHSGSYSQKFFITVSEALAMAGGPNKFAGDQIVILRLDSKGKVRQIPVSYKAITSAKHPEQDICIASGDTVIME
jgi:polysaccharide export outer membrane protein